MLVLTKDGIIAARDKLGRTPVVIGKKDGARAVASETCSFPNTGFEIEYFLGPGEKSCIFVPAVLPGLRQRAGRCRYVLFSGCIMASPPQNMKAVMWKRCATVAVLPWPNAITLEADFVV